MEARPNDPTSRRAEVERICGEMGWETLEWLQEWDGEALADLREVLDEEQYQALLDQLQDEGRRTP